MKRGLIELCKTMKSKNNKSAKIVLACAGGDGSLMSLAKEAIL